MTTAKKTNLTLSALAVQSALLGGLLASSVQAAELGNTDVKYGGYIKLDAIWSDFSDGSLSSQHIGRDFYIPSTTPVNGGEPKDAVFDMHARQSRFNLATNTKLDDGSSIQTKIELDFIASTGGNERVTNSYSPRIRQAYVTYKGWLFGQAWSNFQNVSALPETLDFVGPADGTVFVRQAMAKYTIGNWSFSAENPESTITSEGGARVVTDDASMPDFTARYTYKADWGHLVVAALGRELTYKVATADESETSFGISASGRVNFGDNNLKFMLTQGQGLGRYVGLNAAHGAVYDGKDLHAIDSTSGFIAYQHYWHPQWRSTFLYSFFSADNDKDLLGITVDPTESTTSYSANILYSPVKKLTFGAEYKVATRETESGAEGDLDRLQLSVKYVF
ncbi:DcaP family trimeric outer membrane transporter [Pseudoalteromonas sp. OOF1S-7]|uniref:DcaP family trimeric outer membrane transporter n=1 Tax=Pseudoalteromonas sp. OOF1S-7 TaxID=2917757 RepID=UPI001EF5EAD9|nr:DcaP family trimeric outer membrane transporter [Pseudoalteromonas sp. OOF1S-7]MCG7535151.1 DcaP family trimeric outer membrane transporter [Pseudoalteromonas sp. OOF1S-7]